MIQKSWTMLQVALALRPARPNMQGMSKPKMSWDQRFSQREYLFGTAPSAFLLRHAGHIPPASRILAVADGEGRNSVWLAEQGHQVTAMDASPVGLDKARALAKARGVSVDFQLGDTETWDWAAQSYDVVAAIFIQYADPAQRAAQFAGLDKAQKHV